LMKRDDERALQLVDEAFALGRRTGESCYEPELYRLRAEALHRAGDREGAAEQLRIGLATAADHGALLYVRTLGETAAALDLTL